MGSRAVSWPLTGMVASKVIGSPVKRLVLLTMASRANDDGTGIYASFATMARDCELSRATVKRTIKELEDDGLVRQVGTRPCANGKTNDYTISVRRISALPDIKKHRGQSEPGSERTRLNDVNPVQPAPGSASEPGSERTPTRVTVTPKPILEPISSSYHPRAGANVSKEDIAALIARAGDACNPTHADVHHGADLNRLLRGGCEWEADILPAVDKLAASFLARGKRFSTWALLTEHAIQNRDRRLAGLPEPRAPNEQPRRSSGRGVDYGDIISRVFDEEEAKRRGPQA